MGLLPRWSGVAPLYGVAVGSFWGWSSRRSSAPALRRQRTGWLHSPGSENAAENGALRVRRAAWIPVWRGPTPWLACGGGVKPAAARLMPRWTPPMKIMAPAQGECLRARGARNAVRHVAGHSTQHRHQRCAVKRRPVRRRFRTLRPFCGVHARRSPALRAPAPSAPC